MDLVTRVRALPEWLGGYPFAVLVVAVATLAYLPLRGLLSYPEITLLYIPAIILVARLANARASIVVAVIAFPTVLYLFVPPYYSLTISEPREWLLLATFLLVAVISGIQTGRLRQREEAAVRRQEELGMLNRVSSLLLSEDSVADMGSRIAREVVDVIGAGRASTYAIDMDGRPELIAEDGEAVSGRAEEALAGWVIRNDKAIGLQNVGGLGVSDRPVSVGPGDALEGTVADGVFVPLQTPHGLEGVLYARPTQEAGRFDDGQLRMVIALGNLASAFLENQRLQREAARGEALRQSDLLKNTLISSVSHELKTPLASITATVTGLLEEDVECESERLRSELRAVEADLARLDASIGDLLDVSRLESDSWVARPDRYDLPEILGTVMAKLPITSQVRVTFALADDLPVARVDFAQWARALTNLVENALAYSPPTGKVRVTARTLDGEIVTCVEDEGPGVPDEEKARVFEKFYRGRGSSSVPSGTGLGLAIAREIVVSHGGRIWVEDVSPHGARFCVSLPKAETEAE